MTYGVHLIAAVGQSGQIGLRGGVPWHGDPKYAEETARDLDEFARLTEGGVVIVGSVTAVDLANVKPRGRVLVIWNRHMESPPALLADLRRQYVQRNIWICGGEKVYQLFMPYVNWHHISTISYDGAADAWMPPIIPGWTNAPKPDSWYGSVD